MQTYRQTNRQTKKLSQPTKIRLLLENKYREKAKKNLLLAMPFLVQ